MTYTTQLRSAACIAALVVGGAANADVTAAQVWEDWKAQLNMYGENNVTVGTEEASGNTLVVRDITTTMDDGEVKVVTSLGDLTFTEQGDGSVVVTMAESYPIVMTVEDDVVITVLVSQSDLEMVVTGDENVKNYDISSDQVTIELQDIVDGDITFTGDVKLTANDLAGTYSSEVGDLRELTYDLAMSSLDLIVDIEVPGDAGEYVVASGKIEGMSMQADMSIPLDADFENPDNLFVDGFAAAGGYEIERGNYVFDINADGDQLAGSVSTGTAKLTGEINSQTIVYDTETNDVAINVTSGDFPFPVELALAQYGVGFAMPVGKTEEPADFGLSVDFIDLTINDMIWNMFDPGTVLPRDPATVQLDVSGKAKPLYDMFDPAQADAMASSDMPIELDSLTLNNLRVALAGALVTGSGAFTFDNSDLATFDGMPRPEGDATVEVTGLNKLMDNLVAMGLVPEDQIMGGRMMLGMFARTTGDDQLETTLEVNGEGHVLVNGQRMR